MNWYAIAYFFLTFLAMTLWLLYRIYRIKDSEDEGLKGQVLLTGMVAHFLYSLVIIIVYYRFLFSGDIVEVWIALLAYVISFIWYVREALKVK